MEYLKLNGVDFGGMVNRLNVNTVQNYTAQTNAAGNTVVDRISVKRTIEVGFRPLTLEEMQRVQSQTSAFSVLVSFLDPATGRLAEDVLCISAEAPTEYYTVQDGFVLFNEFTLEFQEL